MHHSISVTQYIVYCTELQTQIHHDSRSDTDLDRPIGPTLTTSGSQLLLEEFLHIWGAIAAHLPFLPAVAAYAVIAFPTVR
jgi:hypothetical protein